MWESVIQIFLSSVQAQISDIMEWDNSHLLECIFLMPCTVVVLFDNSVRIRYFYKYFQRKLCCQKFLSINMVFHFVKIKCPSSANIAADSSPPKTTCIRWNFNNRLTFRSIIFRTIYTTQHQLLIAEIKSSYHQSIL